eukprot:CAMPEP_0172420422 /NCGR_PEP_ID=MMETSP1064-20121228/6789_1 /TAXON_ID=202472 /ORGANISM="Aulacoseira subarctica , Strain CCAP 1002/5" /LENGTH=52 /DNA_ID=CAMNT_0013160379 /DNA_START=8 /DNA_END=166 /DNA_ORIENTATION=+
MTNPTTSSSGLAFTSCRKDIVRVILPVLHFEANPSEESESMRFCTAAQVAAY